MEDARDAIAAERAIAGAVRLSALPEHERRQAAAPLLTRAASAMRSWHPFAGNKLTSDLALITRAWAGERLPEDAYPREDSWHLPGQFAVDSKGRALTMAGIFSARAWEAARLIETGRGGVLLAEPETARGAISPECLLERVRRLARARTGPAGRHDRDQALLRLAPGAPDELWQAWGELEGTAPRGLADSHRRTQEPVSFEAVIEPLPEEPRGRERTSAQNLLARITGVVPAAPQCGCWQLLTQLTDPVAEYSQLAGTGRYERDYDAAVAGWPLLCPWQPEIAAAHLLRPLSAGMYSAAASTQATAAIIGLSRPGHPLGPVGHLALMAGLSSPRPTPRSRPPTCGRRLALTGGLTPSWPARPWSRGSGAGRSSSAGSPAPCGTPRTARWPRGAL